MRGEGRKPRKNGNHLFFSILLRALHYDMHCTVGGSKESRVGTVTLYGCPANAEVCYVGASSSRVAFRAFVVGAGCSAVVGPSLGLLADSRGVLQISVSSCWDRSVRGSRFVGAGFRPFCCFWLGCLLRLVLSMEYCSVEESDRAINH